jgi:hypothetical protein
MYPKKIQMFNKQNDSSRIKVKKQQFAILTVVSMSKSSFGLQDNNFPFESKELYMTLADEKINLQRSILAYNNYGRLTNPSINKWIQENKLNTVIEPVKIVFSITRNDKTYHYKLYKSQGNYLKNI